MESTEDGKKEELRKKAEVLTSSSSRDTLDLETLSVDDVKAIIHDLRVHQIELEIQNEELRHTQTAIQLAKDNYSELYNSAPVGYLVLDEAGIISRVNQTFIHMTGSEEAIVAGKAFADFLHPEDKQIFLSRFRAFTKNPGGKILELRLLNGKGSSFYCRLEGRYRRIRDISGLGGDKELFVVLSDIDEQKTWEQKLEHINTLLKAIRNVNQLITHEKDKNVLLNKTCDLLTENRGYYHAIIATCTSGCGPDKAIDEVYFAGLSEEFRGALEKNGPFSLYPCMMEAFKSQAPVIVIKPNSLCDDCQLANFYDNKNAMAAPLFYGDKVFGIIHVSVSAHIVMDSEDEGLLSEVAGDIAFALHAMELEEEKRRGQEQLLRQLKEKDVLLKEVHHRVKNNLMMMESLLHLQCRYSKSEEFIKTSADFSGRIHALARVHERLYRSESLSMVDFKDYVDSITRDLTTFYKSETVTFVTEVENAALSIDKAIPLGLILNELVSNSLKYAFPGGRQGTVFILFKRTLSGYFLDVHDTGPGLPSDFDIEKTETLGLMLTRVLSEQLGGVVSLDDKAGGAGFHVEFPA